MAFLTEEASDAHAIGGLWPVDHRRFDDGSPSWISRIMFADPAPPTRKNSSRLAFSIAESADTLVIIVVPDRVDLGSSL